MAERKTVTGASKQRELGLWPELLDESTEVIVDPLPVSELLEVRLPVPGDLLAHGAQHLEVRGGHRGEHGEHGKLLLGTRGHQVTLLAAHDALQRQHGPGREDLLVKREGDHVAGHQLSGGFRLLLSNLGPLLGEPGLQSPVRDRNRALLVSTLGHDPCDDGTEAGLDCSEIQETGLEAACDVIVNTQRLDAAAKTPLTAKGILDGELLGLPLFLLVCGDAALADAHHQLGALEIHAEEFKKLNPELRHTLLILGFPTF